MNMPKSKIFRFEPYVVLTVATALLITVSADLLSAQQGQNGGWRVESKPQVDLWYHGLAVVGFFGDGELPVYSPEYAEHIKDVKKEMGVYPTRLDSLAEDLLKDFEDDDIYQFFHFLPLYFGDATRDAMLRALDAIAKDRLGDREAFGPNTRYGSRHTVANFQEKKKRRPLGKFVDALENEWTVFYRQYQQQNAAAQSARNAAVQRRWDDDVAPAMKGFLVANRLSEGTIVISAALGPEGRLNQSRVAGSPGNVVAVWSPQDRNDPNVNLFAIVREMCYPIASHAVQAGGVTDPDEAQQLSGHAAVWCGAFLFENNNQQLLEAYQENFVRVADADTVGLTLAESFERAYALEESILGELRDRVGPTSGGRSASGGSAWRIRGAPQADIWFHALAVIQADQPGPLGLYSADYATEIRAVKQERGVYPTALDSLASEFRRRISEEDELDFIHFVPLYFTNAEPERLFQALHAVARRKTDDPELGTRDVRVGIRIMNAAFRSGKARRLLRNLVDAMENEWEVFYRDYWQEQRAEQRERYKAMQTMWDSLFAEKLSPYLEKRRLTAGVVSPSPALGPEGRIVDLDDFDPRDQVVAVQMPLSSDRPEESVFAFLKELCFLLVDGRELERYAEDPDELEDLRRRAAVRCGALLLDFYAPTLAGRYRRVFLDAVGAEESYTVAAFERVYSLEPEVYELIREEIRGTR